MSKKQSEKKSQDVDGVPVKESRKGIDLGAKFREWKEGLVNGVTNYIANLSTSARTRFLTVMWGFCLIFLGVTFLGAVNPLRLLIPGVVFPLPATSVQLDVKIYGVDTDTGKLIEVQRRMAPIQDPLRKFREIAYLVARPRGFRQEGPLDATDIMPLPRLGYSIRKIWFQNKQSQGRLILDLRRSTLDAELERFARVRTKKGGVGQYRNMDAYFYSLTATLFLVAPEVKSLVYLLDGESKKIDAMKFDLSRPYQKGEALRANALATAAATSDGK